MTMTMYTPGTEYFFRINKYGGIEDSTQCLSEDIVGEEYNPLLEVDEYDRVNPYQDPYRGKIYPITVPADQNNAVDFTFTQNRLLQNLFGHEQILGRSITWYTINSQVAPPEVSQGCCPIVQTGPPDSYRPYPNPYPYFHATPKKKATVDAANIY